MMQAIVLYTGWLIRGRVIRDDNRGRWLKFQSYTEISVSYNELSFFNTQLLASLHILCSLYENSLHSPDSTRSGQFVTQPLLKEGMRERGNKMMEIRNKNLYILITDH